MKPKFIVAFLFLFCFFMGVPIAKANFKLETKSFYKKELPLAGTISGTTTICQNFPGQQILLLRDRKVLHPIPLTIHSTGLLKHQ